MRHNTDIITDIDGTHRLSLITWGDGFTITDMVTGNRIDVSPNVMADFAATAAAAAATIMDRTDPF